MEERQAKRAPSSIPELIKRTKCDQRTCSSFDHNCLILPDQKHFILSANDFSKWDKAIEMGKATLDLPPLNVRGTPVASKKSQTSIANNNTTLFNSSFPPPYPFPPLPYSFPPSPYPFAGGYPMPGYPSYGHPPVMPPAPATPVRQSVQSVFSSPIDPSSAVNKDVSGFMDAMIIKAKDDVQEVNDLVKLKTGFEVNRPDMLVIKNMDTKDHDALGIPWGLGKRLSREAGEFLKKKK